MLRIKRDPKHDKSIRQTLDFMQISYKKGKKYFKLKGLSEDDRLLLSTLPYKILDDEKNMPPELYGEPEITREERMVEEGWEVNF